MSGNGKSAIITGGAGGLGAATVRAFAAQGYGVVIFDRALDAASALAAELPSAVATGGDVTDDDAVAAAITAAQGLGVLSVVVNIAGGGVGMNRTVKRDGTPHSKDDFLATMSMNAIGTFNVSRLAAAAIAANEPNEDGQRGVIVNTGSIAGIEGQAGQLAYGAAKAAILGMTLPMARDLAAVGIRVCGIAPGTIGTPMMLRAPQQLKDHLVSSIVFPKRMGYPDEFAKLVLSIVDNPYLNGENIRLDGALRFPPK
jgi:NAD(P)-dependent dehydrogenase (short-subunit alcohol dehydrogenase family)